MATLCTEIGMPKYRENKKKWESFLPGNIPANICHRQCLAHVKVPASLYSMCHPRVWLCTRFWMLRDTYSCRVRGARTSVYKSSECVCVSEYAFTHTHTHTHTYTHTHIHTYTHTYVFICTSKSLFSSFPAHFVACMWKSMVRKACARPCIHPKLPHLPPYL